MRYWLFQNNQVVGPHDREELAQTAGFSSESLVCPEGRKGTQMGDWQRAGVVAELAELLLKMSKIPAGVGVGGEAGLLPPEPTLRDLAVLGSLQEKVTLLESVLTQLQDDLRSKEGELSQLKVDYELKSQESAALKGKLDDVERRLSQAELLKEELARTQQEERAVADAQTAQAQTLADMKSRVEAAQDDVKRQIAEIERAQAELRENLSKAAAPAPMMAPAPAFPPPPMAAPAAPPPSAEPSPLPPAMEATAPLSPPLGVLPPLEGLPPAGAPPFGEPAALPAMDAQSLGGPVPFGAMPGAEVPPLEGAPFQAPGQEAPPMEFPQTAEASPFAAPDASAGFPNTGPIPMDLPTPGSAEPQPFGGLAETPAPMGVSPEPLPAPAPAAAAGIAAAPPKKKGKGMLIAVVGAAALSMGVGAAFYLGFLDGLLGKKKPAAEPPPQATLPPEPVKPPPAETVKAGLPDRSQDAVDFAKSYLPPGGKQTLSESLEGPNPAPGMSPWTVEHLDGVRYAVSFYDGTAASKRPKYRFEVNLDMRTVSGLDVPTMAFLEAAAKPPAAAAPPAEPKKKRRPKKPAATDKDNLLKDPLGSMLMESSLGESADDEKPAKRPVKETSEEPVDESPVEPPKPAKPAKKGRKTAEKAPAEKPESIDDILAGGDETSEPAAKPGKKAAAEEPAEELMDEAKTSAPAPKKGGKPAKKSKEEVTLDELLLPGVPQR